MSNEPEIKRHYKDCILDKDHSGPCIGEKWKSEVHTEGCILHEDHLGECFTRKGEEPTPIPSNQERRKEDQHDMINHPPHYNFGKYEVIDVIEDWKLGYHLGATVKYIARSKHKGSELEDLKKARWYLDREIQNLEKAQ